jgi:GT2 family glycosyltransferase
VGQLTITVIVPIYNYPLNKLLLMVKGLRETMDNRHHILLMDDHSPDYNLMEIPLPPNLLKGRTDENYGFAGNCNLGAMHAPGDVLLFLNQDCRLYEDQPGWAEKMLEVLSREKVGVVGPRLVFGSGHIQSVGGLFDGAKGPYHRYLGSADAFSRRVSSPTPVSWTTGAALMIRRADFYVVGGFDMGYEGGYFEDVDLCMKVRTQLGKEVWYCPGATFVHDVGSTGGNPHFMDNSRRFHALWDDHIVPDTNFVMVGY